MIFSTVNLTSQAMASCEPWLFVPTETLTEEIRKNKAARQEWYKSPQIRHQFYSLIEASNANQRASSKDNPPRLLHGIAADYDVVIGPEKLEPAMVAFPIKPTWIEHSLGGNLRLLWLFSTPLAVDSYDFCVALLQASKGWLNLDLLPGLDNPALEDPTRLFCNGCDWSETGFGAVPEAEVQAFFFEAGRAFRFTTADGVEIPLDAVEKALKEKFPHFSWPTEFSLESKGPSFWIPGSVSSSSAIVKAEGMFTFSAHAEKPFYTWADILGADFVKQYTVASISKATSDIWYDSRKFWRKKKGCYVPMEMAELVNFLQTSCGITAKGGKLAQTLGHLYQENFVDSVGPFIFRPPGLITFQGKRKLNTADAEVMKPASGSQAWSDFPFLAGLFDNIFTSEIQRDHFLAWFKYFFESGLNKTPMPGQVLFLAGGIATGKTLTSREVIGRAVGGYVDAASYLVRGESFNSHCFEVPLWTMDDETISDSPQAAATVQAALKKATANSSHLSNKKYHSAAMLEWMGRIIITTNTDYTSSRMLGKLDNSSRDKISLFRCQSASKIKFPSRTEILRLIDSELPRLLRWLVDWTPPDYVARDSRFGFQSYQDESLTAQAHQTSRSAPFQELLLEALEEYFKDNPSSLEWRGTASRVTMLLHMNPLREAVMRSLRLEAVARYLEAVEKDGFIKCRVEQGPCGTRVWIFPRFGDQPTVAPAPLEQSPSIFDK